MVAPHPFPTRTALALALLALAGCTDSGRFPSLMPRAIEKTASEAAPAAPVTPAPAEPRDPALAARIAALVQQAERGDAAFQAAIGAARGAARAAAGSSPASEQWVVAQQALSRLDTARTPLTVALADLDALGLAQAVAINAGQPVAEADTLAAAVAHVQALDTAERATITTVSAGLGGISD